MRNSSHSFIQLSFRLVKTLSRSGRSTTLQQWILLRENTVTPTALPGNIQIVEPVVMGFCDTSKPLKERNRSYIIYSIELFDVNITARNSYDVFNNAITAVSTFTTST
ncbi:hypothetical protein [Mechercharimyces sp. CAU 1602]|uniref:hypothetical protein n=1 Tax=Mechercharimyces sp. CAU 1602 TaxID=2973933 RepID=UPI002163EBE6|nr:hypothetical protein [Mechercharimyces sp. CAU 1602]MCS1350442.1 hypothetical protein [Mechercharimyces sp. CAU 1602]